MSEAVSNTMSKVRGLFSSPKMIFGIFFLIAVFVGVAVWVYYNYIEPKVNPTYTENRELIKDPQVENNVFLYLFKTSWCPHSKELMKQGGVWQTITSNPPELDNGFKINFIEIDGDDENRVNKFQEKYFDNPNNDPKKKTIDGFPTIILVKDEQVIEFDANPTVETLTKFLTTVV